MCFQNTDGSTSNDGDDANNKNNYNEREDHHDYDNDVNNDSLRMITVTVL